MGMDALDMQIFAVWILNATEFHWNSSSLHLSSLELLSHRLFLHRSNCSRPSAMRIPDRMRTPHVSANSLRPANCSKEAQRYLIGLDYWKIFENIFQKVLKKALNQIFSPFLSHNLFLQLKVSGSFGKAGGSAGRNLAALHVGGQIGASLYRCLPIGISAELPGLPCLWWFTTGRAHVTCLHLVFFCQILPKKFWDTKTPVFLTKQFFLESADITFSTSWKLPWTSSARRRFKPAVFGCNLL